MKIIPIPDCSACPHKGYTSAYDEGGAKAKCYHPNTLQARLGKEGGKSKLTIPRYPRIPGWCPLPDPEPRSTT